MNTGFKRWLLRIFLYISREKTCLLQKDVLASRS